MAIVTGKTENGFTYEAEYEQAKSGRVNWTATYRRGGDFCGMRHGRVEESVDTPPEQIDAAVKSDIEDTWVRSS